MAVWNGKGDQSCIYIGCGDSKATRVLIDRENGQISEVRQTCDSHARQFPPMNFTTDKRGAYIGHTLTTVGVSKYV
jgi:hypothetical protein